MQLTKLCHNLNILWMLMWQFFPFIFYCLVKLISGIGIFRLLNVNFINRYWCRVFLQLQLIFAITSWWCDPVSMPGKALLFRTLLSMLLFTKIKSILFRVFHQEIPRSNIEPAWHSWIWYLWWINCSCGRSPIVYHLFHFVRLCHAHYFSIFFTLPLH